MKNKIKNICKKIGNIFLGEINSRLNNIENLIKYISSSIKYVDEFIKRTDEFIKRTSESIKYTNEVIERTNESIERINESIKRTDESMKRINETIKYSNESMKNTLDVKFVATEKTFQNSLFSTNSRIESLSKNSYTHFSAYSIENFGDNLLVKSLRDSIQKVTKIPCNWVKGNVRNELTEDAITLINKTNGLFIGGGGLFLKDTNQNEISGWQWPVSINQLNNVIVPFYCLALGYNRFRGQAEFDEIFKENINFVVSRSTFFSMRNHGSINEIRKYLDEKLKDKISFHPCATTILSKLYIMPKKRENKPFIAVNCAFDREEMRFGKNKSKILNILTKMLKNLSNNYEIKFYAHMESDEKALKYFDEYKLKYQCVKLYKDLNIDAFLELYTTPDLMIAMRGHSQLVPFGCGTPTLSIITHDKLKWFLEDIGYPEWGVDVQNKNFEFELKEKINFILNNSNKIISEIENAKNELWSITVANIKSLGLVDRR